MLCSSLPSNFVLLNSFFIFLCSGGDEVPSICICKMLLCPWKDLYFFSASWVSLSVQLSNKICKRDNQFVWLDNCHMVILKTGLVFHWFHLLSSHIHCKVPWNYIWLNYKELFMLDHHFSLNNILYLEIVLIQLTFIPTFWN